MANNDYHFITHWRVQSTVDEVAEILADAEQLPRWWPAVYLEVKQLAAGDAQGVGKRIALYTKGWLPYTLLPNQTLPAIRHRQCAMHLLGRARGSCRPIGAHHDSGIEQREQRVKIAAARFTAAFRRVCLEIAMPPTSTPLTAKTESKAGPSRTTAQSSVATAHGPQAAQVLARAKGFAPPYFRR